MSFGYKHRTKTKLEKKICDLFFKLLVKIILRFLHSSGHNTKVSYTIKPVVFQTIFPYYIASNLIC
jgi:hypothetical protein